MQVSRLFSGAIAGFIATGPMSLAMKAMQAFLPSDERHSLPPSVITFHAANKVGEAPSNEKEHTLLTLLAHFGAGSSFGLVYGLGSTESENAQGGPLRGIIFGLMVWAVNYLGIMPALNLYKSARREPFSRNTLMIVAHLIWGITLYFAFKRLEPALKKLG
jgi:uncharacterized membrane protein YagU involved in acid resistance